jgi:hypothetical protein
LFLRVLWVSESVVIVVMVAIVVVIVIIPIALGVPAAIIFVPPAAAVFPAVGARVRQFTAPAFGLRTLPAVFLDGLMKLVIRFADALLTGVVRPDSARTC